MCFPASVRQPTKKVITAEKTQSTRFRPQALLQSVTAFVTKCYQCDYSSVTIFLLDKE